MSNASDLQAFVEARYDVPTLLDLTNQRDADASAVETNRLLTACTDAIAKFESSFGISFSVSLAWHMEVGADLVMHVLSKRAFDTANAEQWFETAKRTYEQARNEIHRKTIATSSHITPDVPDTSNPVPFDNDSSVYDDLRIK